MMRQLISIFILLLAAVAVSAQTDKADADKIIYQMLTEKSQTENWHLELVIESSKLEAMPEQDIYVVRGDSFQIKSLRSDFYVRKEASDYVPINDGRYPLETMVNLLLNRISDNKHNLELRHHQYGGNIQRIVLPMQNIFDILARNMQLYCSVTFIDKHEIRAILVFHQKHINFIHMLELKVKTSKLMEPGSTISGDFYTNIPQENVNNLFRERK